MRGGIIFVILFSVMTGVSCRADDATRDYATEIAETTEYINLLQSEIDQIDSELSRCRHQKSTWTTMTVVGGIGVIGTGVGALVQAGKIKKSKKSGATEQETPEQKPAEQGATE